MKIWEDERLLYKNNARFNTRAQGFLFGTWHRLHIYFRLSPTKFLWSDWSTRFSLTDLIGWFISDVTGKEALLGFSGQPKSDKNLFFEWVVLDAPVLGKFLSDFVRVKSNVSPRPSTLTYIPFNYPHITVCSFFRWHRRSSLGWRYTKT